jgi:hypothetical protein
LCGHFCLVRADIFVSCVLHAPPSHAVWFNHPNNIRPGVQIMKLFITVYPIFYGLVLFSPHAHIFSSASFFPFLYKSTAKIIVLHILIFTFLDRIRIQDWAVIAQSV